MISAAFLFHSVMSMYMVKTDLLFFGCINALIYTSFHLTGYSLTVSCYFLSKFFSHIEHLKFQPDPQLCGVKAKVEEIILLIYKIVNSCIQ